MSEPDRFVPFRELKTLFNINWSRQHVYRLIKAKQFPKDYLISSRGKAWSFNELVAWQNKLKEKPIERKEKEPTQ